MGHVTGPCSRDDAEWVTELCSRDDAEWVTELCSVVDVGWVTEHGSGDDAESLTGLCSRDDAESLTGPCSRDDAEWLTGPCSRDDSEWLTEHGTSASRLQSVVDGLVGSLACCMPCLDFQDCRQDEIPQVAEAYEAGICRSRRPWSPTPPPTQCLKRSQSLEISLRACRWCFKRRGSAVPPRFSFVLGSAIMRFPDPFGREASSLHAELYRYILLSWGFIASVSGFSYYFSTDFAKT